MWALLKQSLDISSHLNRRSSNWLSIKPLPCDVFSILIELFRATQTKYIDTLQPPLFCGDSTSFSSQTRWQHSTRFSSTRIGNFTSTKPAKDIELVYISAGRLMYVSHLLYLFPKIMIWHSDLLVCSLFCILFESQV